MADGLVDALLRSRRLAAAVALTGALIFGANAVRCARQYALFRGGPRTMTISDAVAASASGAVFARLEDARFDCRRVVYDVFTAPETYIVLIDPYGTPVAVASYHHRVECGDVQARPLVALFVPLDRGLRAPLDGKGLHMTDSITREACTDCRGSAALLGLSVSLLLALLSLASYAVLALLRRRRGLST